MTHIMLYLFTVVFVWFQAAVRREEKLKKGAEDVSIVCSFSQEYCRSVAEPEDPAFFGEAAMAQVGISFSLLTFVSITSKDADVVTSWRAGSWLAHQVSSLSLSSSA